ncbi:MAG: TetR/AcrR family transcriptional regulator [Oscillospiraceae bacterium]
MAGFARKAIRDSFVRLLNEKPISQITVRDIVDDCGVNRNTFYYYFQDLPALVESIVNEEVEQIIRAHPSIDSLEECLSSIVAFSRENRKAGMHIYHSASRELYEKSLWRVCKYAVTTYLDGVLDGRAVSETDRKLMSEYLECLGFGLMIGWLETGIVDDDAPRLHRLCQIMQGNLESMIERCEKQD